MERGRLFDEAVALVRENAHRLNADHKYYGSSQSERGRPFDEGGARKRGKGNANRFNSDDKYYGSGQSNMRGFERDERLPIRAARRSHHRGREGMTQPYYRHRDDGDIWKHDLFDGDAASNPGSQIFIRNLPQGATKQQLVRLFSKVGEVVIVKIDSGPLPTARVGFLKPSSGPEAISQFHGYKMMDRVLKVSNFETLESQKKKKEPGGGDVSSKSSGGEKERSTLMSDIPQGSVFDRMS